MVAVETGDDGDTDEMIVDFTGSHFVSIVRSFGDTHFTLATFLTGSLLFRFDVLFSDFLTSCLSALQLLDDDTDGRLIDDTLGLVDGVLLLSLSLDKFVGSSDFCSVFGIFGNCTKGESVLGMRGFR